MFNLQQCEGRTFKTHHETLDYIKTLGFPVSPRYSVFENIEDAIKEIESIGEARGTWNLTLTARSSRSTTWPPAARWAARTSSRGGRLRSSIRLRLRESVVRNIEVTVGRTGVLTPTAVLT